MNKKILVLFVLLAFTGVGAAEKTVDDYEENTTWILGQDTASVEIAPEMASNDYEENNSWVLPGLVASVTSDPVSESTSSTTSGSGSSIDRSAPLPAPEEEGGRSLLGGVPEVLLPEVVVVSPEPVPVPVVPVTAAPQKLVAAVQPPAPVVSQKKASAVKSQPVVPVSRVTRRSYYSPRLSQGVASQRFQNLRNMMGQLEQDMLVDIENYQTHISSRSISAASLYTSSVQDLIVTPEVSSGTPQTYLMSWQGIDQDIVRYQTHQKTIRLLTATFNFFFVLLFIAGLLWALKEQEKLCLLYEQHVRSRFLSSR